MAPNQRAVENHEELFPNHVSTLAVTDPELIETFDNFAFDEVLSHSSVDVRTRLMVQLSAIIACQAVTEYRVMTGAALDIGVAPVEIKEILYQAVPYLGIAKVVDFIRATNDVLRERGVELPGSSSNSFSYDSPRRNVPTVAQNEAIRKLTGRFFALTLLKSTPDQYWV
jgi:4-carboxymuconolactone decarboxylase